MGAIAGAGLSALGGILGNSASQGDVNSANDARMQALAALQGVHVPTLDEMEIQLQKEQMTGQIDPALQDAVAQAQSAANGITTNPDVQQAQMQALSQLQQLSNSGLRPQDIAAIMSVNQNALGTAHAQQASLLQQMQQQGQGSSGGSLAARMLAGQTAANSELMGGLQVQGQAAQNAQNAMVNAAGQANTMQTNSFGQQMQQAAAQNAINQFNAQNQNSVNAANVASKNQAQAYNVGTKQNVANTNTDISNQQEQYNKQLPQQIFNDQFQKATGEQSAYNGVANQDMANAGRTQQLYSGVGQGLGSALTTTLTNPTSK
jgi:hypothetical protein